MMSSINSNDGLRGVFSYLGNGRPLVNTRNYGESMLSDQSGTMTEDFYTLKTIVNRFKNITFSTPVFSPPNFDWRQDFLKTYPQRAAESAPLFTGLVLVSMMLIFIMRVGLGHYLNKPHHHRVKQEPIEDSERGNTDELLERDPVSFKNDRESAESEKISGDSSDYSNEQGDTIKPLARKNSCSRLYLVASDAIKIENEKNSSTDCARSKP